MDVTGKLRPGMRLVGPDERDYGVIDRWDDAFVYSGAQRVPHAMIERVDKDRLYVGTAGAGVFTRPSGDTDHPSGEIRVPIVEEQLAVDKRQVAIGEVQIHKSVDLAEQVLHEPVVREEVEIERTKVNRPAVAGEAPRQEGEWLIVPVLEERLVVQKQVVVTEEIRIRRRPVTEQREIRDTVRREQVTVDEPRVQTPASVQAADLQPGSNPAADQAWDELREEILRADQ